MSWSEILGHQRAQERFRRSVVNRRLASTYLFVGPDGVGKHRFALKLAEALLCDQPPAPLEPCGTCAACVQVKAQSHPDLILLSKPADRAFIPLELFIGKPDHRRQTGLCHEIGLKPFRGGRKIAIIDDADYLNIEGANALLKTLEEPPPHSLLILVGSGEQKQLSTIVSRSQIVRFDSLSAEDIHEILGAQALETTAEIADLAAASGGSVARAMMLADEDVFTFRSSLLNALASLEPGGNAFGSEIVAFVDAAGKDSALKRARLVLAGDLTIDFFRQMIAAAVQSSPDSVHASLDSALNQAVDAALNLLHDRFRYSPQQIAEAAGTCIERTINLQSDVHTNAMPANIIPPWLRDIGRVLNGEMLLIE